MKWHCLSHDDNNVNVLVNAAGTGTRRNGRRLSDLDGNGNRSRNNWEWEGMGLACGIQ